MFFKHVSVARASPLVIIYSTYILFAASSDTHVGVERACRVDFSFRCSVYSTPSNKITDRTDQKLLNRVTELINHVQ